MTICTEVGKIGWRERKNWSQDVNMVKQHMGPTQVLLTPRYKPLPAVTTIYDHWFGEQWEDKSTSSDNILPNSFHTVLYLILFLQDTTYANISTCIIQRHQGHVKVSDLSHSQPTYCSLEYSSFSLFSSNLSLKFSCSRNAARMAISSSLARRESLDLLAASLFLRLLSQ